MTKQKHHFFQESTFRSIITRSLAFQVQFLAKGKRPEMGGEKRDKVTTIEKNLKVWYSMLH